MTAPEENVVLLSVRSPHVERLLGGSKTVELRRRAWKVPAGTTALLYRSGKQRAIVGSVVIESTVVGSRTAIWRSHGSRSGLTRREYREYFHGADFAVAITVRKPRTLDVPLTLDELRQRSPHFHVPYSYRFMPPDEIVTVLNGERSMLLPCAED